MNVFDFIKKTIKQQIENPVSGEYVQSKLVYLKIKQELGDDVANKYSFWYLNRNNENCSYIDWNEYFDNEIKKLQDTLDSVSKNVYSSFVQVYGH